MKTVMYYRNVRSTGAANVSDSTCFLVPNCAGYLNWNAKNTKITPTHRHDCYILYVAKGGLRVLSSREPQIMLPGHFVCFYPESEYFYETLDEGVSYYFAHFTGHSVQELLDRCGIENQRVYNVGVIPEVCNIWMSLLSEFSEQDRLFSVRASAKLVDIISRLSDRLEREDGVATKKLRRSIDYIHENFNKDISVPELAELEHLSGSRYYTLFKEKTGYSPSEYIIVLRMNRACTLMLQEDMTVKETAIQVGYHDPFYFSRLFKKYMGISPAEYKKQKN
ncbi:MAG: helix-turn-helix transcriptional regulator [Clostridia bacterium]|nr:helix-turn-helix transcriptional regulator [Clostridia bacterium]